MIINDLYNNKKPVVAEGLDPEKKQRLKDLIDQYRDATDPETYYGLNDEYPDAEEVIAQIRQEFGDRTADSVEQGPSMHYPRPGHSMGYDPMQYKSSPRITKSGVLNKQDVGSMKRDIKQRLKQGMAEAHDAAAKEIHGNLFHDSIPPGAEKHHISAVLKAHGLQDTDAKDVINRVRKMGYTGSRLDKSEVDEVSDKTLINYLHKVSDDSLKHGQDPTKRSAEKRNRSVTGFSRAFNKLDSRKPDGSIKEAEEDMPVHRIGLTVIDPQHPMVSKRREQYQKTVRVPGHDREQAITAAINHLRRRGYKVLDHHYMGLLEASLGDYRKKAQLSRAMAQTNRFFGRDDPKAVAQADQTIAKRERGMARADARSKPYTPPAHDAEKHQRDLTAKYPNIDELVRQAELRRDPNYDYAEGDAYYRGREAEQNYQRLKQIQRVIQGLNESLNRSHLP
jgi:hypothetical protein